MNLRKIVFNDKKKIFCILMIAFFNVIIYKNVLIAQIYPDSSSYIGYSFKSLLHLDLVSNRTFGYPLFLRICQYLFGEQFLNGVVILQIVISCVSFLYLYKAGSYILKNKKIALLLTVLYASSPAVIGWNTIILTESLAISGTVFFIYALTKYLENTSVKNGVIVILWAFCLVWIKPALIVYDGIFLVFLIMRFFTERHHIDKIHILYLIAGVIFSFILFGVYSYFNYKAHGTFSLTPQGPRHLLAACLKSGIYKNYPDAALVSRIQDIYMANHYSIAYDTTTPVMQLFGDNDFIRNIKVKEFVSQCLKNSGGEYVHYLFQLLFDNINTPYTDSYNQFAVEAPVYFILIVWQRFLFAGLTIGHVYIVGLIELIFSLREMIKHKLVPWIDFGIAGFIMAILISVYIGTYAEYMRSTIYILPFMYLGIGLISKRAIHWIGKEPE